MSRIKHLILPLVLIMALLLPLPVAAEDPTPDTCLSQTSKKCYASNQVLAGTDTETDADGTAMAPWLAPTDQDMLDLRNAISEALDDNGYGEGPFYFAEIICYAGGSCKTTWYEYDEDGEEVNRRTDSGIPPEVGVSLPFPYILGGGAFLGILLVGIGVFLRRRTG